MNYLAIFFSLLMIIGIYVIFIFFYKKNLEKFKNEIEINGEYKAKTYLMDGATIIGITVIPSIILSYLETIIPILAKYGFISTVISILILYFATKYVLKNIRLKEGYGDYAKKIADKTVTYTVLFGLVAGFMIGILLTSLVSI